MNEHYCTYEQSIKLKEFGFSGEVTGKYVDCPNDPTLFHGMLYQSWNLDDGEILAPRLDQVQAWLRDKGIHVSVNPYMSYDVDADGELYNEYPSWSFELMDVASAEFMNDAEGKHDSYESALSAGIGKALELLADKLNGK